MRRDSIEVERAQDVYSWRQWLTSRGYTVQRWRRRHTERVRTALTTGGRFPSNSTQDRQLQSPEHVQCAQDQPSVCINKHHPATTILVHVCWRSPVGPCRSPPTGTGTAALTLCHGCFAHSHAFKKQKRKTKKPNKTNKNQQCFYRQRKDECVLLGGTLSSEAGMGQRQCCSRTIKFTSLWSTLVPQQSTSELQQRASVQEDTCIPVPTQSGDKKDCQT